MLREKICAVLGLARAGIPAARFIAERGAQVIGYDDRPLEELSDEARALTKLRVQLRTGDHGYKGLHRCSLIVLSPGLKIHHEPLRSVLAACEARGSEIIGELELAARHCPAPMIAVTGTKGKSTTVKLIEEMLRACGLDAVRAGNTGIPLIAELPRLSPQSWAVVEVSSFQLEKAPTLKPRVNVLLNLLEDHQDYHTSLDQYWDTKFKLFAHQRAGDTAIFNVDDPRVAAWVGDYREEHPAMERGVTLVEARLSATPRAMAGSAGRPMVNFSRHILAEIPLKGEHNYSNVVAALEAVRAVLGPEAALQKRAELAGAIRDFESLPHRLEVVGEVGGVTFVNDSQATIPEAAIRALEAFAPPVTLIVGGLAKLDNADAFDALGRAIVARAHLLISIGKDGKRIEDAVRRAGGDDCIIVSGGDLTAAVDIAIMRTPAGGTVVLSPACASFDQFKATNIVAKRSVTAVAHLQKPG